MKKLTNLNKIKDYLGVDRKSDYAKLLVTPDQAKFILTNCNRVNRKIKNQHVETLRRDMENGNWYPDIDYIGFNSKGMLINGQHRLKALSEAMLKSILLKFDFDVEQHISMDTGSTRTYSDQIAIFRKLDMDLLPNKYKSIIVTGVKLTNRSINLSNTELSRIWEVYHGDFEECDQNGLFNLGDKSGTTAVKASLFWAFLSGVSIDVLSHIAKVLRTGITESQNDIPVIRLRDALVDLRGSGKDLDIKRAQYTQQCIFNVLQGSTSNRLPNNPIMHYQNFNILHGIRHE